MRRASAAVVLGWAVFGVYGSALATVYVPGQYRSDGIYIRPHFKASAEMVPEIAQFPPLVRGGDGSKSEMKLPVLEVPPPGEKEPPAPKP